MIRAAGSKPSLFWEKIALGSMFLCSSSAFASEALWKTYIETGTEAFQDERYATAETMFLAAGKEADEFGSSDVRVASTLFQLALVYYAEKKYEQAEPNYRRAVEIWDKAKAPPSIERANALSYLGILSARLGAQQDAQRFYERALEMREKLHGPAASELIIPLTNLAGSLEGQYRYQEAETDYRRALEIAEKHFKPEAQTPVLRSLANNLSAQKRYDEAAPLFTRVRAIAEKAYGPTDFKTAIALYGEANNLYFLDRSAEAEPLCIRALEIFQKEHGPKRVNVADTLSLLAYSYDKLGRVKDAEQYYKKSIAMYEEINELQDPLLANVLEGYAGFLRNARRPAEAKSFQARADAIRAKHRLNASRKSGPP
jgi:tetratricopeptide (TPR) repeat protein